jgi:hypothetical protein
MWIVEDEIEDCVVVAEFERKIFSGDRGKVRLD